MHCVKFVRTILNYVVYQLKRLEGNASNVKLKFKFKLFQAEMKITPNR